MKNKIIMFSVGALVVGGLIGFWAGSAYGSSRGPGNFQAMRGGGAQQFRQNNMGARSVGGIVAGDVVGKDEKSITVKLRNGGSRIVFTTASTTVLTSTSGKLSDIGVGSSVMIDGGANSDGSITAQSIQVRPAGSGIQGR